MKRNVWKLILCNEVIFGPNVDKTPSEGDASIIPSHEQRVLSLVTETRKRQNVKCCEKCLVKNGNVDFFVMTLQMSCGAFRQRERVTLQTYYGAERVK